MIRNRDINYVVEVVKREGPKTTKELSDSFVLNEGGVTEPYILGIVKRTDRLTMCQTGRVHLTAKFDGNQ